MTQDERIHDMVTGCMHQIRTRALRDAPVYLSHVSMAQHTLNISIKSIIEEAVAAERERLVAIIWSPETKKVFVEAVKKGLKGIGDE